jgi:hypothetical protein
MNTPTAGFRVVDAAGLDVPMLIRGSFTAEDELRERNGRFMSSAGAAAGIMASGFALRTRACFYLWQ